MNSRSHPSLGYFFRNPPGGHFFWSTSGGIVRRSSRRVGYLLKSSLNKSSWAEIWVISARVASTFARSARPESWVMSTPARMPMMTMTTIISTSVKPWDRSTRVLFTTNLLDVGHFENRQHDRQDDESDHNGHDHDHQRLQERGHFLGRDLHFLIIRL